MMSKSFALSSVALIALITPVSASAQAPAAAPAKRLAEDAPAEDVAEGLEDVTDIVELVPLSPREAGMAEAVVTGPQFLVGEHLERPGGLLEPGGGLVVARVLVGVEADRQFSIRVGNLRD